MLWYKKQELCLLLSDLDSLSRQRMNVHLQCNPVLVKSGISQGSVIGLQPLGYKRNHFLRLWSYTWGQQDLFLSRHAYNCVATLTNIHFYYILVSNSWRRLNQMQAVNVWGVLDWWSLYIWFQLSVHQVYRPTMLPLQKWGELCP